MHKKCIGEDGDISSRPLFPDGFDSCRHGGGSSCARVFLSNLYKRNVLYLEELRAHIYLYIILMSNNAENGVGPYECLALLGKGFIDPFDTRDGLIPTKNMRQKTQLSVSEGLKYLPL